MESGCLGNGEGGSRKRVLVCDDEHHIIRLIQVNLERQGYEVVAVLSGKEAIELLQRERFDLAILDPVMPSLNGLDVKRWIDDHEEAKDMKVILLDGKPWNWKLRL